MTHSKRLLLATVTLWLAALASASALSVAVVNKISDIQNGSFPNNPYVYVQVPDPTVSQTPPNGGGALFAKITNSTETTNNGCVTNGITVVVDTAGNCFTRTDKLNIRDFGAKGDTRSGFIDGNFLSPTTFASASANFTAADIGKEIYIQGAGDSFTPTRHTGNPNVPPNYKTLDTTITAYTPATMTVPAFVTLAASLSTQSPGMWGAAPGITVSAPGTNYTPGDILSMASGGAAIAAASFCPSNTVGMSAATCNATVMVTAVDLVSASINNVGTIMGPPSSKCTITGTDGTFLGSSAFSISIMTDANGNLMTSTQTITSPGSYTGLPPNLALGAAAVTGCPGLTNVTLTETFGIAQTNMVFNGIYLSNASQQFPTSPVAVNRVHLVCQNSACSGATFNLQSSQQPNIFSVGTDDTFALLAAVQAQNVLANLSTNTTNMNSKACIYAPAGVYSVVPLNQVSGSMTAMIAGNGCIEGDGQQQTIFHVRPNVGGDLFAWHNSSQANSLPFNGSIGLLNTNQAGAICRRFGVEGDRTSSANQNALVFYGANDYISCTDIQVDYLLGSALRCADPLTGGEKSQCRESHFHDLRFTRDGDGNGNTANTRSSFPVISWTASGNTDGDNNLDISDVDIYNPRGTGMYFSDSATGMGNADHNIAMTRIRWEGSESSVAGVTSDLLQIDGGAVKGMSATMGGTANITCLECRWENPYFNSNAIHFTAGNPGPPPSNIVLDGRVIGSLQSGLGRGVQIDAGSNLALTLSVLTSTDFNVSIGATAPASNIFLNGYGAELGWSYSVPSAVSNALVGPIQRMAANPSGAAAIRAAQPTVANNCNGTRGQGAADLQTDCNSPTQGAIGNDSFVGSGQGNVASGNGAAVAGGTGNIASGLNGFAGGAGAADNGRIATNCWSSAPSGLSQTCVETLAGNATGGNAIRLTANGLATVTLTNTFNIPDYSVFSLRVSLTAIDISTPTLTYTATWSVPLNLSRGSGALTTALNGNTGSTPTIGPSAYYYSGGSLGTSPPGLLSADNSNGGLSVSFMPPNSDRWHVAARIESTEVK